MNTEQERADFEAWHKREMWDGGYESGHDEFYPDAYRFNERRVYENMHTQIAWRGYQAGRAALQSHTPNVEFEDPRVQLVYGIICGGHEPPEGEHWDGYVSRLIVDALQSQDKEDAERYRWLRKHWFTMTSCYDGGRVEFTTGQPRYSSATEADVDEAIDHARRI